MRDNGTVMYYFVQRPGDVAIINGSTVYSIITVKQSLSVSIYFSKTMLKQTLTGTDRINQFGAHAFACRVQRPVCSCSSGGMYSDHENSILYHTLIGISFQVQFEAMTNHLAPQCLKQMYNLDNSDWQWAMKLRIQLIQELGWNPQVDASKQLISMRLLNFLRTLGNKMTEINMRSECALSKRDLVVVFVYVVPEDVTEEQWQEVYTQGLWDTMEKMKNVGKQLCGRFAMAMWIKWKQQTVWEIKSKWTLPMSVAHESLSRPLNAQQLNLLRAQCPVRLYQ